MNMKYKKKLCWLVWLKSGFIISGVKFNLNHTNRMEQLQDKYFKDNYIEQISDENSCQKLYFKFLI